MIVSCMVFGPQVVTFLVDVKVHGNTTDDGTMMLTITVKHSFNMKSRAILHTASLDRSKFLS